MSSYMNEIAAANEAWENGEWNQAIQILEQINELKQDDEVISVLIHFYVKNKQYKAALQLIGEQSTVFVEQNALFDDYFEALIQTNYFILARKEILNFKIMSKSKQTEYLARLNQSEKSYAESFPQTVMEIERDFYHVGDKNIQQQQKVIERAYHLPYANFKRAAMFNLIDPFLNQLTRVSILKDLALIKLDEEVQFIWIDAMKIKIIPAQIKNDQLWNDIKKLIKNDSDPIQIEMLLQQAKLFYDLAYPFPERIFKGADEWTNALKDQLYHQKAIPQFDKLNQIMINIFEGS